MAKTTKTEATIDVAKTLRAAARELHKGMPRGGLHGSPKGKRGYTRKAKHKGRGEF